MKRSFLPSIALTMASTALVVATAAAAVAAGTSGRPTAAKPKPAAAAAQPPLPKKPVLLPGTGSLVKNCLLYTSPSPRDGATSRMPSSA